MSRKSQRWFEREKKLRALAAKKREELAQLALTIKIDLLPQQMQMLRKEVEKALESADGARYFGERAKVDVQTKRRKARKRKQTMNERLDERVNDMAILHGRRMKPSRWFKQAIEIRDSRGEK